MAAGIFTFPKIYQTDSIILGPTVSQVYVTIYYTGDILFYLTADGGSNWEAITLASGVRTVHNFSTTGTDVRLKAIGTFGSRISTQINSYGGFQYPGIKIEITGST